MKAEDVLAAVKDSLTVKRVYADPIERDGTTVIAAAAISGGGGGGGSTDEEGREGSGGGYGVSARPVGAYVIKGGQVRWQPAVDANRLMVVVGVGALAFTALVTIARIATRRVGACRDYPSCSRSTRN